MLFDKDEIKNELQGDGFLEEVKEQRLPDSTELSNEALSEFESRFAKLSPGKVREDADTILRRLLQLERDIYDEREQDVYRNALVIFLEEKYDTGQTSLHSFAEGGEEGENYTEYEHLQRMFKEIEDIYTSSEDFDIGFKKILRHLYPAIDAISVSAAQSRRKRAGSSLHNHLENLIQEAGFYIVDSLIAGNGSVYHLSMTNPEVAEQEIEGTPIYISSLTTMRDRFRQSLSDNPGGFDAEDLPQFITTASGNNLATTSAQKDITREKIDEITNEGFTLVVFDEIKREMFPDTDGVISYSDFFGDRIPDLID